MTPNNKTWWETAFPVTTWLRNYQGAWFRLDLLAGVTLAAYLLPAALGDASLANLPPEVGLYACLFGGLFFGSFAVRVTPSFPLLLQSRSLSARRLARLPAVTPRASARSRRARRCWSRSSPSLHGSRKQESWSISSRKVS